MSFDTVTGQELAKRMLMSGLAAGKVSHAYIFAGPKGTGKRKTALAFAKALFCSEGSADACGVCLECRKVEHGNHPDLHFVQPQGASIKIEQIRELQKQFSYRSAAGARKIYVMEDADRMTVQASNGLLKFLEEPSPGIVAVLLTENGHALLPTIRSRAQWIPFYAMNPQQMAEALYEEGFQPALVNAAVHLTAGIEAAREILQTNWFAEIRSVMIQLAKEGLSRSGSALLTVQQQLVRTDLGEHTETLFSLFILWFKDLIYIQCGHPDRVVFSDQMDWMKQTAFSRVTPFWVRCVEAAVEAQKRLRFHSNPQLVLEQFLIGLEGR